jgi:hypothetical protein
VRFGCAFGASVVALTHRLRFAALELTAAAYNRITGSVDGLSTHAHCLEAVAYVLLDEAPTGDEAERAFALRHHAVFVGVIELNDPEKPGVKVGRTAMRRSADAG